MKRLNFGRTSGCGKNFSHKIISVFRYLLYLILHILITPWNHWHFWNSITNGNSNQGNIFAILSDTWKYFWQRTGISGISNAREAKSSLRTKVWTIIFALFSIFTISGIYNILQDYSDWPVTTSITVKNQNQVILIQSYIGHLL